MGILPAASLSAPKGFRPVTMSQAMIEFAEPVMEFAETGTVDDTNEALQVALLIWNYTLPSALNQTHSMQAKVVAQICTTLKMPLQEAEAFLDQMIERKAYLFPEEIQPEGPTMTMFMRKEVEYLVKKFDADQLTLSETPIPLNPDDRNMLEDLHKMDAYIADGADYED